MNVWEAIWDRLSNDAPLVALVGTDETGKLRSYPERPHDELTDDDYPRMAVMLPVDQLNRAVGDTQIQLDIFGFELDVVKAIDVRLQTLLHEQVWSFSGNRVYSWVIGGGSRPNDFDQPYHFMRELRLQAS